MLFHSGEYSEPAISIFWNLITAAIKVHFQYNLVTNMRARKPLLSNVFHSNTQKS